MLPASFTRDGFKSMQDISKKRKRVMIGTEGESESGKTEFILSAPGPGIIECLDRGHEAMLDNPTPPETRGTDFAFDVLSIPLVTQVAKEDYLKGWQEFKGRVYKAISYPECLTVAIDTDNASWELQQLAEFGKLTQIPPIMRTSVNAARRAFIAKLYDSGKNIIATNMLTDEYSAIVDGDGKPILKDGKEQQEKTGERRRQGFKDQNYLWQIQLRHFVTESKYIERLKKTVPRKYGIKILKCKANGELVGEELTGGDCCFASLVQLIYPGISLSDWGYKP